MLILLRHVHKIVVFPELALKSKSVKRVITPMDLLDSTFINKRNAISRTGRFYHTSPLFKKVIKVYAYIYNIINDQGHW